MKKKLWIPVPLFCLERSNIKKKSQTGLLHPIIYKSTYICVFTLNKTCIKNQINYSQKKGGYFIFFLNVKFKVFCMNLRQNFSIYTSPGCSFCISCVICPHPNIRQFSDHSKRPKKIIMQFLVSKIIYFYKRLSK